MSHVVAIIGGATAGAEVAGRLAERGAQVVVFEMNPRPYGKIEDGLPRWHAALREKEYATISEKLARPGVHFVPNTKIGRDVGFEELAREWGFSAVVLACGAWNDRPLPIEGADAYLGKGLIYQNPFIIWFNHSHEAGYDGPVFEPLDDTIVVGGGLASIDVAKVVMLETTRAKLAERGIEVELLELEVKGIPKTLAAHGLTFEDLGLQGCTIFYRRRVEDMPLVTAPEGASPERLEKVAKSRERILAKATEKYRFALEPCSSPDGVIARDGQLVGLRLRRTVIENGRVIPTDETYERRGSCVISSIGSIPEPLPGIPMKGELFAFCDWENGRLAEYPNVFSVGNIVTGKGNIVASRKHARQVSEETIERYLGLGDSGHDDSEALGAETDATAGADLDGQVEEVAEFLASEPPLAPERLEAILSRVRERQAAVGYGGDYAAWLEKVAPVPAA